MKKIILAGLMLSILFITEGCVKLTYDVEINNKNEVSISDTTAMNLNAINEMFASFAGGLGKTPDMREQFKQQIESEKSKFESEGYEVEYYEDENFSGLTKTKKNIKLEKFINANLPEGFSTEKKTPVVLEKSAFKTKYSINWIFDFYNTEAMGKNGTNRKPTMYDGQGNEVAEVSHEKVTDPLTGEVTETITYANGSTSTSRYNPQTEKAENEALMKQLEAVPGMKPVVELTIKIPKKATKHNATKVISKTEYQWDLASEEPVPIILEYEVSDYSTIGVILSLVLVLGLMAYAAVKMKDNVTI